MAMNSDVSCCSGRFGNFEILLEQIFVPAGVKEPVTAQYQLGIAVRSKAFPDEQQQFIVPMAKLDSLDLEQLANGCIYESEQERRQVSAYLRTQIPLLLAKGAIGQYFPNTGWYPTPDHKYIYCAGKEILPCYSTDSLPAKTVCDAIHLAAPQNLDINDIAPQFLEALWKHPEYRIPAFAYNIFSSLRSLWEEADLPFACSLLVVGKSGTGKTTLAKNFCQVYDDKLGQIADYYDVKGTKASMTDALYEARDRTVLYDDICRSSDRANQRSRLDNAVELIRFVANEAVKVKKVGRKNELRSSRAGLVITAEILPLEISELSRCIVISVEEPHIGGTNKDRILTAGLLRAYLSWSAENIQSELENLRLEKEDFGQGEYPDLERLWVSTLQMNWCMESFWRFLKSIPDCQDFLAEHPNDKVDKIFRQLFNHEVTLIHEIEQSRQPIEQLILLGLSTGQLPYRRHKGCYCVRFKDLLKFLRNITKNQALSQRELSTYLHCHGLIQTDASGRVSKKKGGVRYVFLKPDQLGNIQN